MADHDFLATSFGGATGEYEAGRPDYPLDAVRWLLPTIDGRAVRVVDVGAGTGKLSRGLRDAGADVVAVDPDPGMLDALRATSSGIPAFVGRGEDLPLPDDSVDAVVFGQSWHWVRPPAASAEAARVLRPGGVLGLIWNIRDEAVEWVARMGSIMDGSAAERMLAAGHPPVSSPFGPLEEETWSWSRPMTRFDLRAMAFSRSHVITASDDERARIDAELADLFDDIGAVGDEVVDVPYLTYAFRARVAV
ncbi:class I SAM-dependent methyltransferase [Microbacterium sp. zg.Y1090]|uniref:class I SAM-dependent methyltransferase n=1 Tax=Microbacterium TaxID=33882 RepID=UPI00214B0825|nr:MULTISPECIES: class I SAM-dependent methyltransferase [unclassified Microbacterium]MCR2812144.1 class I SAM-dependent methyltransferase [Microbacterium sp. zg.Y1084]MCR2818418.1 class I SAM-dependent methyltransferase [Microbacterium sp. zg.Y1090]MDL5486231.1 class I SAM-dependent methyltransferase [Microbacterium sp. zg-Y1211]WIM29429.1 class I SAM-dependent methyltransferase [Microbacterium sp. zg-Y1090]